MRKPVTRPPRRRERLLEWDGANYLTSERIITAYWMFIVADIGEEGGVETLQTAMDTIDRARCLNEKKPGASRAKQGRSLFPPRATA